MSLLSAKSLHERASAQAKDRHAGASTMDSLSRPRFVPVLVAGAVAFLVSAAAAAPPTKEECLEAHGKGQDLRDQRQLARARAIFQVCASNACPALVQADCARFSDELSRVVPSLSFASRDERQGDLPNTAVYVDEMLIASQLDEGRLFDVDPGKHTVRFVHEGREVTMKIVVNQGEKGRPIVATFGGATNGTTASAGSQAKPAASRDAGRGLFPLVIAGAGLVAAGVGAALIVAGSVKVPSNCSVSAKECAAPPGDKSFDDAHSGVTTMNAGVAVSVVGGVALLAGIIWYFAQTPTGSRVGPDLALRF
jgi:hypothetical protein